MRHVLRAPGGRSEVTLHQGEEGGLKLTKRISHDVEVPGDVVDVQAASMLALVQASRSAEGACAAFGGGGALYEA